MVPPTASSYLGLQNLLQTPSSKHQTLGSRHPIPDPQHLLQNLISGPGSRNIPKPSFRNLAKPGSQCTCSKTWFQEPDSPGSPNSVPGTRFPGTCSGHPPKTHQSLRWEVPLQLLLLGKNILVQTDRSLSRRLATRQVGPLTYNVWPSSSKAEPWQKQSNLLVVRHGSIQNKGRAKSWHTGLFQTCNRNQGVPRWKLAFRTSIPLNSGDSLDS